MTIALTGSMLAIMLPTDAHATETDPVQTGVSASSEPNGGNDSTQPTVPGGVETGNDAGMVATQSEPDDNGNRDDVADSNASIGANKDDGTISDGTTGSIGADNAIMPSPDANGMQSSGKITDANNDGKDDATNRIIIPCQPSGAGAYDKVNHWEWAKDNAPGYDKDMYEHWSETFGNIKSSEYCWFNFKNFVKSSENSVSNYGDVHDAVDDETTHAIGQQTGGTKIPVIFELNENEWITADIKMAMSNKSASKFICGKPLGADVWTKASAIPNAFDLGDSCLSLMASNWGYDVGTHSMIIDDIKSNVWYDYRMMFADAEIMSPTERTVIGTDTSFDYDYVCSAYDYHCKTNGSVYSGGMYVSPSKNLIDFIGGGNNVPWNGSIKIKDDASHGAMIASTSSIPNRMQVNMKQLVSEIALGLRLPTFLQDNARLVYDGNGAQSGYVAGNNGAWDSNQTVKWNSKDYSGNPFAYQKTIDGVQARMVFMGWNTNKDDPTKGTWYCDDKNANTNAASQAYGPVYEKWKDGISACRTTIALSRQNDVLDGKGDGTITLYAQWLPAPVMKSMPMTGSRDGIILFAIIIGMIGITIIMRSRTRLSGITSLSASNK